MGLDYPYRFQSKDGIDGCKENNNGIRMLEMLAMILFDFIERFCERQLEKVMEKKIIIMIRH